MNWCIICSYYKGYTFEILARHTPAQIQILLENIGKIEEMKSGKGENNPNGVDLNNPKAQEAMRKGLGSGVQLNKEKE